MKTWLIKNIFLAKCLFPDLQFGPSLEWILLKNFPLPSGWFNRLTSLLIVWQGINGDIFHVKPNNFYVDIGLRLIDGSEPSHIFEDSSFNDLWPHWARASWHIESWKPSKDVVSGHNILSIFNGLDEFFRKIAKH